MGGDGLQQQYQYGRHVLGPLGSQENIAKQQVVFRGGKKMAFPSPLIEHAQVAGIKIPSTDQRKLPSPSLKYLTFYH